MCEYIYIYRLSDLNKNHHWDIFEGAKHDSETRITNKMADPINVKLCRKLKFGRLMLRDNRNEREKSEIRNISPQGVQKGGMDNALFNLRG
jgi:hypothetical protein